MRKLSIILYFFFLFLLFYGFVLIPALSLVFFAKKEVKHFSELKVTATRGDFGLAAKQLTAMIGDFHKLKRAYAQFSYLRFVPFLNLYYQDGEHLLEAANYTVGMGEEVGALLSPLQNVLGAKSGFGELLTTRDYLDRFVQILPAISARSNEIAGRLFLSGRELLAINPNRYPGETGRKIAEVEQFIIESKPVFAQVQSLLEILPHLLGAPKRTYLVLFQNDAELRATGGFVTSLSLIDVDHGKVGEIASHNIGFAANQIPAEGAPMPYRRYLNMPIWGFHDVNLSPDFRVTGEKAIEMWRRSKTLPQNVDFIIAVNGAAGQKLLEFTGPITLPGYPVDLASRRDLPAFCRGGGPAFTAENLTCKLEFYIEAYFASDPNRKGVMGMLSQELMEKMFAAPKSEWPKLFSILLEALQEKTILLYSIDPREQKLIEQLDFGGRIKDYSGDYLHISDSNFGGRKTDLVMQEEVEQELVKTKDGSWRKTVHLTYNDPQPYDHWLSSYYKDWVRIYVPKGSRLISVNGAYDIWTSPEVWSTAIENPAGWEELGKSVFAAFFTLWPPGKHTVSFTYELPAAVGDAMEETKLYKLSIQKQPGTNIGLVRVKIGAKMETFDLKTDREIEIKLE